MTHYKVNLNKKRINLRLRPRDFSSIFDDHTPASGRFDIKQVCIKRQLVEFWLCWVTVCWSTMIKNHAVKTAPRSKEKKIC